MLEHSNNDLNKNLTLDFGGRELENISNDENSLNSSLNQYFPDLGGSREFIINSNRSLPSAKKPLLSSKLIKSFSKKLLDNYYTVTNPNSASNNNSESQDGGYLDIFDRKSFRGSKKYFGQKHPVNFKANYRKDTYTYTSDSEEDDEKYDYPVKFLSDLFFTWTFKLLRIAQRFGLLKISHLGKFNPVLSPKRFLEEIKPKWEKNSKNINSNPLLMSLLESNIWTLVFVFLVSLIISFIDFFTIIIFREVLLHFDSSNKEDQPQFTLLSSIVILLFIKLFHIFLRRFFESYTLRFGTKLTIQINTLIYNKLLKISPYASISEGDLVNFIQIDAEKFGDFFSYTPATFVLPFQIIFSVYLLFKYFGLTFIFGFICLITILLLFFVIQKMRNNYQKELLKEKNKRMRITSQALDLMKIIKMNCWENYFYEKIKNKRDIELDYLKKIEKLTLFVNSLFWCSGNITSLVSILAYSFFNEQMDISNILTSLYIFNSLGEPLFLLPDYITNLGDSLISLKRLEKFLFSKEYNKNQLLKNIKENNYAIYMKDLDFGINLDEDDNDNDYYDDRGFTESKEYSEQKNDAIEMKEIIDLDKYKKKNTNYNINNNNNGNNNNNLRSTPFFDYRKSAISEKSLPKIKNHNIYFASSKKLNKFKKTDKNNDKKEDNNYNNNSYYNTESGFYPSNNNNERKLSNPRILPSSNDSLGPDQKYYMTDESYSSINLEFCQYNNITPLLQGITLRIPHGDLIGITGEVGSGKTCLLNAILNNLDILNKEERFAKFSVNGTVSYVPQTPWIFNDTVKGNILFNKEYDEEKYNHIINICQIKEELQKLEGGDFAEIGERGVQLSNGLQVKISIARAIYANSDIYLFDDPLSLLDTSIGRTIFNKVIKEYLKSKTVLITTHALQYIPLMKHVIHMTKGKIDFFGTAEEALNQTFFRRYVNFQNKKKLSEDNTDTISAIKENFKSSLTVGDDCNNNNNINSLVNSDSIYTSDFESKKKMLNLKINHKKSNYTLLKNFSPEKKNNNKIEKNKIKKSVKNMKKDKDKDNSGTPNLKVLQLIFNYSGGEYFIILIILINIFWKTCESGSDYIITTWSVESQSNPRVNVVYLILYSIISLFGILFIFFRTYTIIKGILKYNKHMHNTLLQKLFNAPINLFYDLVPDSHIENRLSKDLENSITFFWSINSGSRLLFQLLSSLLVAVIFNYFSILIFPLMILLDYYIFNFYIKGGRALNNLETQTRAQLTTKFTETLNGISSIRGFKFQEEFRKKYHQKLHDFYRVLIYQAGTSCFFALNVDLVSFCLLFFILTFCWLFENFVNPLAIGLLMSYTLKMIENTYGFFEQYCLFERTYSSMDSCEAYTKIIQEMPSEKKTDCLLRRKKFPTHGKIQFINYKVKYRPDTKFVLGKINITIEAGEKIGIVGKTGSGKSTLCLGLLRIVEAESGKILIDDVDISQIGLKLLRESISVIPQDPILIDCSLRENIDPLRAYTDEEILSEMEKLGLTYLIDYNGLDLIIKESGKNLSVGERQLICIARALLRKSKIIVIDEATSSIDYKTEMLIRNSLEHSFKDKTLITIASQKVQSVMGCDKIYVLHNGKVVDFGKPNELLEKKSKIFCELYRQSQIIS